MKEKLLHGDNLGGHFIYESLIHHPRISGANLCILGKETSKQEITIIMYIHSLKITLLAKRCVHGASCSVFPQFAGWLTSGRLLVRFG